MYVNLSKSGVSVSFGPRGYTLTLGKRGVRNTVGVPGTGLFYTHHTPNKKIKEVLTRPANSDAKLTEDEIEHLHNYKPKVAKNG